MAHQAVDERALPANLGTPDDVRIDFHMAVPCPLLVCAFDGCMAQAFALEAENKKLVRALQREVGEEVPLAKVLDEGGDWKGRREQLLALREQVKQLKAAAGYAVVDSRQEQAAKQAIGKIVKDRSQASARMMQWGCVGGRVGVWQGQESVGG